MAFEYTRAQAMEVLFKFNLTSFTQFRTKISTLEDNGSIQLEKESPTGAIGSRGRRFYLERQLNRLHNVVLISGFYSKPAIIKDVADNLERRQEHVAHLRDLLEGRDRVGDIEFDVEKLKVFLDKLDLCQSLDDERLPIPFKKLPQVIDNGTGKSPTVLEAYSNDSSTSPLEKILAAYLDDDIKQAYRLSKTLGKQTGTPLKIKQWIEREYREAQNFNDLLGSF